MSLISNMEQPIMDLFDRLAVPITYNGKGINAVVRRNKNPHEDRGRRSAAAIGELRVKKSDVAVPEYNDATLIDGETWRMKAIVKSKQFYHVLRIETDQRRVI